MIGNDKYRAEKMAEALEEIRILGGYRNISWLTEEGRAHIDKRIESLRFKFQEWLKTLNEPINDNGNNERPRFNTGEKVSIR